MSKNPESPSMAAPPKGTVTCPECAAINPGGVSYCMECGTTLDASGAASHQELARRLRHEATTTLKRAHKSMNTVTIVYHLGAAAYAVATLFAIFYLARPDIPRDSGLLVVALTTALSAVLGVGALQFHFRPFEWTAAIAALAAMVSIVHFVGPNPLGVAFYGSAAWALLAAILLVPSLRFRKLMGQHRDLYILQHAGARTRRALSGRPAPERHDRLLQAMRHASRRAWRVSSLAVGALCAASALGSFFVLTRARPRPFEPVVARFESAWNGGDLAAVNALFDARVRDAESARLTGLFAAHGWDESTPPLSERARRVEDANVALDYAVADLVVTAEWVRVGPGWSLVHVEVPIPSLQPTLERFLAAWRASDPEALADFYAEDARADMRERITKAVLERGWTLLPRIGDTDVRTTVPGEALVTLELEQGAITTEWHFRVDGQWRLHYFKLPPKP